jgi:hypothetical protein
MRFEVHTDCLSERMIKGVLGLLLNDWPLRVQSQYLGSISALMMLKNKATDH